MVWKLDKGKRKARGPRWKIAGCVFFFGGSLFGIGWKMCESFDWEVQLMFF